MSHADTTRDALIAALRTAYAPVYAAGGAYALAHRSLVATTDVEAAMAAAISSIVAAEALEEAAKAAARDARDALMRAIDETGAPRVQTMHHNAALANKPAFASEDQPELTPPEYMTKPQPDRRKILDALKRDILVPGWSLRIPNAQTLRITKRK